MALNIIVCVKSVVLEAPSAALGSSVERTPRNSVLNPFDRPALALALELAKEEGGLVTTLSMGPPVSCWALCETLALGADRAVLISDKKAAGSDTMATTRVLAKAVNWLGPWDILLFGSRTADSDTGQVGPQASALLNKPFVGMASSIIPKEGIFLVESLTDGFVEQYLANAPFAASVHPNAASVLDCALASIRQAFDSDRVEVLTLADIGMDEAFAGEKGSPTRVISMTPAPKAKKCAFIEGGANEQAQALLEKIRDAGLLF
ncbi:MAG: electron transfer flavoprotein subunit beta/FixA family protein [Desulfatibacillaceae bacterium]|nr:electron transfer flavoprotein subunit beta/FixA family protein [Desulfatibacillaceae bacterium]